MKQSGGAGEGIRSAEPDAEQSEEKPPPETKDRTSVREDDFCKGEVRERPNRAPC